MEQNIITLNSYLFEVHFTDGTYTTSGAEHLWTVITPNWKFRGTG